MATILRRTPGKHRAGRVSPRAPQETPTWTPPAPPAAVVVVRPEVLRTIAVASAAAGERETGGPLVGTVQSSWSGTEARLLVSVLGTVPPAGSRSGQSWVNLGRPGDGERASSALRWWRAVTGLDLRHLGDWHKHLAGVPQPSGGDARTAAQMAAGSSAPVWLAGVTVGDRRGDEHFETDGYVARYMRASAASNEVRLYRQVEGRGLVPVPVRVEGEAIPGLPSLPWHVADPERFAVEYRLLRAAGFSAAIDPVRRDGRLGLSVRLARGGQPPLVVLTGLRYPLEAPATVDPAGRTKVSPSWGPGRFLVDLAEEAGR